MSLTFRAHAGQVLMRDGPHRETVLDEDQCNTLLDVWEASEAQHTFNDLYAACQKAGFIARCTHLRLVSDNTAQDALWHMLAASCAAIELEAAIAAQAMENLP